MSIETWSDEIFLANLESEPSFSEDLMALHDRVGDHPHHVVLNCSRIKRINSSNIAQLLRLRKKLIEVRQKMRLCCVPDEIWSVMMVTGLDQVFEFAEDVPSALAGLQIDG